MKKLEEGSTFTEGLTVILIIAAFVVLFVLIFAEPTATSEHARQQKMIEECEKNLPRTQKCVLIAVPETPEPPYCDQLCSEAYMRDSK